MTDPAVTEKFKTLAEINHYLGGATIKCLICGRHLQQLGNHIRHHPGWDCDNYKVHFGIPSSRRLVSGRLHEQLSAASAKMMAKRGDEWRHAFHVVGKDRRENRDHKKPSKFPRTPAVLSHLRQVSGKGGAAVHEKYDGRRENVNCPNCDKTHEVAAWAAFRRGGVLCRRCSEHQNRSHERNRPPRIEYNKQRSKRKYAELKTGVIKSQLSMQIFGYIQENGGHSTMKEIRREFTRRRPDLLPRTFKKRVGDLLAAGKINAISRGVYQVAAP